MNFKRFLIICALMVLVMAGSALAPVSAQDANDIDIRFFAEGGGGCSISSGSTGFGLDISYTTPVDLDFVVTVVDGPEGIRGSSDSGVLSAGTETDFNLSVDFDSEAVDSPWTIVIQLDAFLDGELVAQAHGFAGCDGAYSSGPYSSSRVTVKSAELSSGVMFDDTRIEMEIGETGRFSLYATIDNREQPVLLLFRTDESGNDRLIYRVNEADIARFMANPPLESTEIGAQRGVRLLADADGVFQLEIAPPGEDMTYVIVFDGLPLGFAYGRELPLGVG
jgi:hypothetical protein